MPGPDIFVVEWGYTRYGRNWEVAQARYPEAVRQVVSVATRLHHDLKRPPSERELVARLSAYCGPAAAAISQCYSAAVPVWRSYPPVVLDGEPIPVGGSVLVDLDRSFLRQVLRVVVAGAVVATLTGGAHDPE